MFEQFSHPFILTLYPFNVLRKVFKRFVVPLRECNIHLMVISDKTLKTVSFHTGSRWVLYKIFEGIRFQQTHNRIACLQLDHVHWFASTDRFALQLLVNLTGKIRWNMTPLLPVVPELHTMKLLSKQLTNWEDWILCVSKIMETDISRTIQRRNSKHSFVQLCSLFEYKMSVLFSNGHDPRKSLKIVLRWLTIRLWHSESSSAVTLVLHADWMMLKNVSNQRGVNSVIVTMWLVKYRLRMFKLFC